MVRIAAQHADIINFPDRPSSGTSTAGNPALGVTFEEQLAIVKDSAGERYQQLELGMAVHPSLPTKTVAEFVAYAKANSGKINMHWWAKMARASRP